MFVSVCSFYLISNDQLITFPQRTNITYTKYSYNEIWEQFKNKYNNNKNIKTYLYQYGFICL